MKRKLFDNTKAFNYILNAINTEDYEVSFNTDLERVKFVYDTFISEYWYDYNKQRYGSEVTGFAEYLKGLPSVINIDYENYRIIEISKQWESIPQNADDRQEDKILDNWFNFIANKFFQLKRQLEKQPKKEYERKTKDEYKIQGNYGQGFEDVTSEDNLKEAKQRIKEYRENEKGVPFKIVKKRIKITN